MPANCLGTNQRACQLRDWCCGGCRRPPCDLFSLHVSNAAEAPGRLPSLKSTPTAPVPISAKGRAPTDAAHVSSSTTARPLELSSSAPAPASCMRPASKELLSVVAGLQQQQPQGALLQPPKQPPKQTPLQQPPPPPFAAGPGILLSSRALSGPVVLLGGQDIAADDDGDAAAAAAGSGAGPEEHEVLVPASSMQSTKHVSIARRLVRQLSSPVPIRALPPQPLSTSGTPPAEAPGLQPAACEAAPASPPPSRTPVLAASPVRALLGAAGRHLLRQRSSAAQVAGSSVAAMGAASAAATTGRQCAAPALSFSLRSPLPSPIRGLLQQRRRQVPPAGAPPSASASLFAAAQWKPSGRSTGGSSTGACSGASVGGGLLRACSMGPPTVLSSSGSLGSSTGCTAHDQQSLLARAGSGGSSSNSVAPTHAAMAAGEVHGQLQLASGAGGRQSSSNGGGSGGGSGGGVHAAPGCSGNVLLLSRYPSAPDPAPLLLALSPVRGHARWGGATAAAAAGPAATYGSTYGSTLETAASAEHQGQLAVTQQAQQGSAPVGVAAPDQRGTAGLHGMRVMWLKVQGMCRVTGRHAAGNENRGLPGNDCILSRSP